MRARAAILSTKLRPGLSRRLLAIVPDSESTFEFGMHDSEQVDGAERLDLCVVGKPDLIEAVLVWPICLGTRRNSANRGIDEDDDENLALAAVIERESSTFGKVDK